MDISSITLAANVRTKTIFPGRFFMLIETDAPLDVSFELNGQTLGEVGRDVEMGYTRFPGNWSDPNDGLFTAVILESATAQVVRVAISFTAGDYRRFVNQVRILEPNLHDAYTDAVLGSGSGETALLADGFGLSATDLNTVRRIRVRNDEASGGDAIRVHPQAGQVSATSGWRVLPGEEFVVAGNPDLYAISETINSVAVTVWVERVT